ncbi:2Fe-2S iron-sulfur cluster binding domain-containing protein [Novosphingobium flavum]|uniref:2Fe-2S iron-sulfur cluster binding domain-containing protein n=1 Tax=Novosphingobium aerophilum TaxID=2839843 RepID=A0A7X1F4T1_9SPHN|nr:MULTISPECIES: 2Fe-2S iron-sulfur cluster-binding protein [Novosphingobium]MBC2650244.1 2Fe-2S iron-sulfur cluster binding domain-containing protein [Novosphingobium aerophilum]MBC2660205.1 2Fe-2S iron-sulfur cluster binding domain-containing protein [Novosphingobium aerophilum]
MATITFIQPDGTARACVNFEGMTLMQLAVGNLVDGIDALCGGMMQCATCHCWIDEAWIDRTGPASPDERAMIEGLSGVEVRPTSRLSCQVQLGEELDGLIVHLPPDQPGI